MTVHERTDPPVNRHGDKLNDDYMTPACGYSLPLARCISNACCCTCHAPTPTTGEDHA